MVRLGALPAVISVVSACLGHCARACQTCQDVCPGYDQWCVGATCDAKGTDCIGSMHYCMCNVFGCNCDACNDCIRPTYQALPTRNKCDDYETYARWSPKEKKAHLGSKYCAARTEVSTEFVEALWQAADRDGDGNVSCAEFNDDHDVESASLNLAEPICQGAEPLVREGNSSDITASKLMRMPQLRGGVSAPTLHGVPAPTPAPTSPTPAPTSHAQETLAMKNLRAGGKMPSRLDSVLAGLSCCKRNGVADGDKNQYCSCSDTNVCQTVDSSRGACYTVSSNGACCPSQDVGTYWFPATCS